LRNSPPERYEEIRRLIREHREKPGLPETTPEEREDRREEHQGDH
jgi:hypothetical protein